MENFLSTTIFCSDGTLDTGMGKKMVGGIDQGLSALAQLEGAKIVPTRLGRWNNGFGWDTWKGVLEELFELYSNNVVLSFLRT